MPGASALGKRTPAARPDDKRYPYQPPGVSIPPGSLDRWKAARNNAANQLVEVPVIGDSTTWGQAATNAGAVTTHTWINDLRGIATAAGYPDGGRGLVGYNDDANLGSVEGYSSQVSKTSNWHPCFDFSPLQGEGYQVGSGSSTTAGFTGEVLVLKGKGTQVRVMFTRRNQTNGAFTVSVDGGAAVTLTCADTTTWINSYLITGLTEGDHTVTITTQDTGTVTVAVAFLRAKGLVWHKVARSGTKMTTDWWTTATNRSSAAAMGLADPTGQFNSYYMASQPTPQYPRPPLTIMLAGGNDQSAATTDALSQSISMQVASSVGLFAETCRAAQCDGLVLIPQLILFANNNLYAGQFRKAIAETARSYGLAIADMMTPLGTPAQADTAGYTYQKGVHLQAAGYQRWAQWLWANVLSL